MWLQLGSSPVPCPVSTSTSWTAYRPDVTPSGWLGSKHQLTDKKKEEPKKKKKWTACRFQHQYQYRYEFSVTIITRTKSNIHTETKSETCVHTVALITPLWGTADAEIQIPSAENSELS